MKASKFMLNEDIHHNTWHAFQQALIQAVIAGGTTAMQFYQQPMPWPSEEKQAAVSKNPSTLADLQATLSIVHVLDNYISPICEHLACDFFCLGEETHYRNWFQNKLPPLIFQKILSSSQFFNQTKGIRVIIDGIDGTGNFIRGIPLFCSAAALFVDDQVRISAMYDPIHHVVYSALLPGDRDNICTGAEAWECQITTNQRIDLVKKADTDEKKSLDQEGIGVHLTRNHPEKVHEFLKQSPNHSRSILEHLSNISGGIYAFNSGLIAMIDVARGSLGAYLNNTTHLWDIAAGEVLIRACGGKVTDFNTHPISYASQNRISVIAARQHVYDEIINIL
ncbi:MAG: hypothetical protein HQK75_01890 [Candidatus Magnetomorum sp.]|nr:hypothetical protein [Candidatus Magnetomorum sp.]